MAINLTSFTKSVDNIQKLSDKPNETDGLSAQGLKERFDRAALDLKDFINGTLLKELESHLNTQSTSIGNNKTKIEEVKNSLATLNDDYGITKDLVSKKINIYELSTTKVDTGKRDNGDIVYAIKIPVTLSNTEIQIDLTELNIKKVINMSGTYSDESNTIPIVYYIKFAAEGLEYFISTSIYQNKVYLRNSAEYAGLSGDLILEYTERGE
jgi:hypothetical protein